VSASLVTVVTSVFNGAPYLERSLESVLSQRGVELEVIAVDDGSTDGSSAILGRLAAKDARLRVLRHENRGLTRSLVRGCAEARGMFIARHDADDLSLPGRLAAQASRLSDDPSVAFVGSAVHCVGPRDEMLFDVHRETDPHAATRALLERGEGPVHGSVMFRTADYAAAGGYRPQFRVAQDWDLWLRLLDRGLGAFLPETLYAHRIQTDSISARRRAEQTLSLATARRCRDLRAQGLPEEPALRELASSAATKGRRRAGGGAYFVGKCLMDRRDRRAVDYLRRSVEEHPLWIRARLAHLLAKWVCRSEGATLSVAT